MRKITEKKKSTRFISFATVLPFCLSFILMAPPSLGSEEGWLLFNPAWVDNLEIEAIHLDGSNRRNLTNSPQQEVEADWSPDGKKIVFARQAVKGACQRDLFLMSANGVLLKQLTKHPACDRTPRWSPDGKSIAFVSLRDGGKTSI